jgi:hypothetical protein
MRHLLSAPEVVCKFVSCEHCLLLLTKLAVLAVTSAAS